MRGPPKPKGGKREEFPPSNIMEIGRFQTFAQKFAVCKTTCPDSEIPLCESNVYDQNSNLLGRVHDVLGRVQGDMYVVVEPSKNIKFEEKTVIYMNAQRVKPLQIFLPKPEVNVLLPKAERKALQKKARGSRGGFRGRGGDRGGRGGRGGGFRGGRGGDRGFRGGRGGGRGGGFRGRSGSPAGGRGGFRGGRGGGRGGGFRGSRGGDRGGRGRRF